MKDIVYCVFRKVNGQDNSVLVGVFDNEKSAKNIMNIIELINSENNNVCWQIGDDDYEYLYSYCMETELNLIRHTENHYFRSFHKIGES